MNPQNFHWTRSPLNLHQGRGMLSFGRTYITTPSNTRIAKCCHGYLDGHSMGEISSYASRTMPPCHNQVSPGSSQWSFMRQWWMKRTSQVFIFRGRDQVFYGETLLCGEICSTWYRHMVVRSEPFFVDREFDRRRRASEKADRVQKPVTAILSQSNPILA